MGYYCISKGLFLLVQSTSEMSQQIWVIGALRLVVFLNSTLISDVPIVMGYYCIMKGLFLFIQAKFEMSQQIWVVGALIKGYFSCFSLNPRCPNRYSIKHSILGQNATKMGFVYKDLMIKVELVKVPSTQVKWLQVKLKAIHPYQILVF